MFLVSEDLSAMPEQELDMLIEYFARVWKEKAPKKKLRATQTFLVYEFSMVGVGGGRVALPMRKITTP
jgi:hypothetical protein